MTFAFAGPGYGRVGEEGGEQSGEESPYGGEIEGLSWNYNLNNSSKNIKPNPLQIPCVNAVSLAFVAVSRTQQSWHEIKKMNTPKKYIGNDFPGYQIIPGAQDHNGNAVNIGVESSDIFCIVDGPTTTVDFHESKYDSFPTYKFNHSIITFNGKNPSNPHDNYKSIPHVKYLAVDDIELVLAKDLLFGSKADNQDICRWFSHGFCFAEDIDCNNDIRFGLLQLPGGPCGILAPVQAYMLREMLFNRSLNVILKNGSRNTPILPTNEQRETALINAIVHMIHKCSINSNYLQWIVTADIEHKKYWKVICHSKEELARVIRYHSMPLLYSKIGVACFVFSVLFSRTLDVILCDMNDSKQPLLLKNGYCSQIIVNLMITGCARADDGDPKDAQDIGFLTTLETMQLTKVDDNLKFPYYPIWVIGSSSHYSVLFSLDINVSAVSKEEKKGRKLKRAFYKFDQDGTGILKWSEFPKLLKELKCEIEPYSIKSLVDPNNMGCILWSTFIQVWDAIENEAKNTWQCPRCTLYNKSCMKVCSICYHGNSAFARKTKDHKSVTFSSSLKRAPMQFVMYLYNGLKAKKTDRPTITKLMVFDKTLGLLPAKAETLASVIRTKWPFAAVEYYESFEPDLK